MATLNNTTITEDFSDSSKLLFPISPWTVINDGGIYKLISNSIGNSATTSVSFAINCSHLEIDYKVSSENNYDCLYIYVDNSQKIKVSGTSMTTCSTLSIDLTYGNHTVKFQYSKDSSGTGGSDRGEIWGIRYTTQIASNKYLILDGSNVLTVPSGTTDLSTLTSLTTLGSYPMSDTTYFNSGIDLTSINYIINNKRNLITNSVPRILASNISLPACIPITSTLTENGIPFGQIVEMKNDFDFSSSEISHINKCTINATVGTNALLKFVFSKDEGTTWVAFNGTDWITVDKTVDAISTNGMTLDVCNALTETQLTSISDTKKIKVVWVMKMVGNDNVNVKQVRFDYATV